MSEMPDVFWRIRYKGKPMRLTLADLSLQRLREMKARFGPSYGIPTEYISLLLRGDMDAIACAVWIGQQKAGGTVEDPSEMDFSLADLEKLEDAKPAEAKGKKKAGGPPPTTTGDSGETRSPPDTSTSDTSPTSAD